MIGGENILASRLQPNHPYDDVERVAASTFEGLSYGCGDAVIGLNPAMIQSSLPGQLSSFV